MLEQQESPPDAWGHKLLHSILTRNLNPYLARAETPLHSPRVDPDHIPSSSVGCRVVLLYACALQLEPLGDIKPVLFRCLPLKGFAEPESPCTNSCPEPIAVDVLHHPKLRSFSTFKSQSGIRSVKYAAVRTADQLSRLSKIAQLSDMRSTWTPKVCKIMAFMAIFRCLGLLFYILWGFRYKLPPQGRIHMRGHIGGILGG